MPKDTIVVVVILLFATGAPRAAPAAEGDGTVVAGELGAAIDSLVQRETGGGFWGAVLVARAGEVLLAKGYGFADYATTLNTPRTLFELASASKQFTAAAVLRLAQQGKLRTKDPLSRFFPKAPKDKAGIYFSAYGPGRTRMELTEGLVLTVLPEYRGVDESGNDVVDRRVVFILDDVPNRQWPFMAKLGAAAADGLLAALRKALG